MILELSAVGVGIGTICMLINRDETDGGWFFSGLMILICSICFGFALLGGAVQVKTVSTVLSIPIEVTETTAVASYGSGERDFVATHDIRIVTHPEKYVVQKKEMFNSYGLVTDTKYEMILREKK